MQTRYRSLYILTLLVAGYGGSACEPLCDTNRDLCQKREIDLRSKTFDKGATGPTASTLSIKIPGGLLPGSKVARLLAPLPEGAAQPELMDMPAIAVNDTGEYTISLDENREILKAGCTYYLNVFQGLPSYQIVDDICKYPVSVISSDVSWNPNPISMNFKIGDPVNDGNQGVWLYNGSTIILLQSYKGMGSMLSSRYSVLSFNGRALSKVGGIDSTIGSFAYFKNAQGLLADYVNPFSMSPDIYRPTSDGNTLTWTMPPSKLMNSGQLVDIAADNGFTFFVAVSVDGLLQAWNMPTTGVMPKSIMISMSPQNIFKKVAILKQNADELINLLAFDEKGNPHVFLQQPNGSFFYDTKLTTARKDLAAGSIAAIAVGDIDGDTIDDLAIVRQTTSSTITFYLNKGDGSFRVATTTLNHTMGITSIAIGPVGQAAGSAINNLVVLDSARNVAVYQNQTGYICPLTTVDCALSPATVNAR